MCVFLFILSRRMQKCVSVCWCMFVFITFLFCRLGKPTAWSLPWGPALLFGSVCIRCCSCLHLLLVTWPFCFCSSFWVCSCCWSFASGLTTSCSSKLPPDFKSCMWNSTSDWWVQLATSSSGAVLSFCSDALSSYWGQKPQSLLLPRQIGVCLCCPYFAPRPSAALLFGSSQRSAFFCSPSLFLQA